MFIGMNVLCRKRFMEDKNVSKYDYKKRRRSHPTITNIHLTTQGFDVDKLNPALDIIQEILEKHNKK